MGRGKKEAERVVTKGGDEVRKSGKGKMGNRTHKKESKGERGIRRGGVRVGGAKPSMTE